MKVKCDYCGSMIEEDVSACPNCGAALNGVNRFADKQPRTIEELREWYVSRRLPPEEVTRFFIGKDVREPRAFGIYRTSTGDFVVYKNKSNGQRAVRYQGSDEAYAVNELYQRMRAEIADQKSRNGGNRGNNVQGNSSVRNAKNEGLWIIIFLGTIWSFMAVLMAVCILSILFSNAPREGYYRYNGDTYYYQDSSWYYYNDLQDDWSHVDSSQVPAIDKKTQEEYATDRHTGMQFEDSTWYEEDTYDDYDYDDDWDSDYDWDSGDSWDSGGTDWDSDW